MTDEEKRAALKAVLAPKPSMSRTYTPPTRDEIRARCKSESASLKQAVERDIPFVSRGLCPGYRLVKGLILVGAPPGGSKTTTAANIAHGILKETKYGVVVISNEESVDDFYKRIACLQNGSNFFLHRHGRLGRAECDRIGEIQEQLSERLIVDSSGRGYESNSVEDVVGILRWATENLEVGAVILDYTQTVRKSLENPLMDPMAVHKLLGSELKKHGQSNGIPVVALTQLHPANKEDAAFADRTKVDRYITEHAEAAFEIKPDMETGITTFKVHKDRQFQMGGKEFQMRYHNGAYLPVSEVVDHESEDSF